LQATAWGALICYGSILGAPPRPWHDPERVVLALMANETAGAIALRRDWRASHIRVDGGWVDESGWIQRHSSL